MAAAQGTLSFAAINAADFAGFATAIAAQLNLWTEERRSEWQQLIEAVAGLRQSAVDQSIATQELVNRVTLVEINGNRVVDGMANWATQSDEKMKNFMVDMDTRRAEILDLTRQAQGKFLEVTAGSESLQEDFRTFASQSDHRFQTFETRLDDLALPAVSTAQEDPL